MNNKSCKYFTDDGFCEHLSVLNSQVIPVKKEIKQSYFDFRKRIDSVPPKIGYSWGTAHCPFYSLTKKLQIYLSVVIMIYNFSNMK